MAECLGLRRLLPLLAALLWAAVAQEPERRLAVVDVPLARLRLRGSDVAASRAPAEVAAGVEPLAASGALAEVATGVEPLAASGEQPSAVKLLVPAGARGGHGVEADGAAVLVVADQDPQPSADDHSPSELERRLAAGAFGASLVALLLSVVAIGTLCRLLGAARQLELIDAARQAAMQGTSPGAVMAQQQPGGAKPKRNSITQQRSPDAASRPAPRGSGQKHRLSRHFEDFHGVPLEDGAKGDGAEDASVASGAPDFNGVWECVETWGLDEFLQAIKVGRIRRMAAMKAPWPTWQLTQIGDDFTYINRSKFGTMTESFKADGTEYSHKDLEGNESKCTATVKDQNSLVIERVGKQGKCWETRTLEDGEKLAFTLQMEGIEVKWGRRFLRKPGTGGVGAGKKKKSVAQGKR